MRFLGPSIEVPPKSKEKKWQELFEEIERFRTKLNKELGEEYVTEIHALERKIESLGQKEENKDRNRLIKDLESRIEKLREAMPSQLVQFQRSE